MATTQGTAASIAQALADWRANRAYIDGNGQYHVKREGRPSGPIAPWNQAAKHAFASVSDLHVAAFPEEHRESTMHGTTITALRTALGTDGRPMPRASFAQLLGVRETTVYRWERDLTAPTPLECRGILAIVQEHLAAEQRSSASVKAALRSLEHPTR